MISVHMAGGTVDAGWDTPGVPWCVFFSGNGVAIHSTFWHNNFGTARSHGCLNAGARGCQMDFPLDDPCGGTRTGRCDGRDARRDAGGRARAEVLTNWRIRATACALSNSDLEVFHGTQHFVWSGVSCWNCFVPFAVRVRACCLTLRGLSGRARCGRRGRCRKPAADLYARPGLRAGLQRGVRPAGRGASALGGLLYDLRVWLARLGGLIIIVFGLHMTGVFRIPLLEYDTRVQSLPDPKFGYLSSALMGVFFSAGWSPCVGPVLGAILTFAMNGGSVLYGASLLSAYSAGLAIPFLLAALGIGWVTTILRKYGKVMRWVEIAMGILLVIVGAMLMFGVFNLLARYGTWFDFGL